MILGNVQSQGNRFLEMSMIRGTKIFSCPLLWVHYNSIPIFAVSTYNTDYLLTKKENYEKVIKALKNAGYKIIE